MSKCYRPTANELKGAPRLVLYELKMLDAAVRAREDPLRSRRDASIGSAFTDSALLHARNLYDFLTKKPSAKDDIVAGHFARGAAGTPWTSNNLHMVRSLIEDINKFRNHLTYSRLRQIDRKWPIREIRNEISQAFCEFIAHVPDSERVQWQT